MVSLWSGEKCLLAFPKFVYMAEASAAVRQHIVTQYTLAISGQAGVTEQMQNLTGHVHVIFV